MTRQLSRQSTYDELVKKLSSPYNQYTLTGKVADMLEGFTPILTSLRYNFPLLTSEVKFTDRVYVRGSDLLTGMYTGHFGRGFEFPSLVATWKNTGPEVSVFVRRGDERSALVSLFNRGKAKAIEMNTWRLAPGEYKLTIGTDSNDDLQAEEILTEQTIRITERIGRIEINLPAQKLVVVELQQLRADGQGLSKRADVAISERDIAIGHQQLEAGDVADILCTVHNIGSVAARQVTVALLVDGKLTDRHIIPVIEAPNDLEPRAQVVRLQWKAREGKHQLTIQVSYGGKEITSINNEASIGIEIPYWPSNDHP